MSSEELKQEIQKVLEDIPDSILQDILDYLKQVQSQSKAGVNVFSNLKKILSEDKELLSRLAK
jgi:hypothetical protein